MAISLAILLLVALVGVAAATVAEGCKWRDNNPTNGVRDKNPDGSWMEPCEAGWVLHVVVQDENGVVVPEWDKNFVTNTDGSSGKFSIGPLPVPPLNTEYTITISEPSPPGYVVIVPSTVEKSYTQKYSQSRTVLTGFLFGNQPTGIWAQGCTWVDADNNGERDLDKEPCEAGWTLHMVIRDENGAVVPGWDKDFVTNTLGEDGKFLVPLYVPRPGVDYTVTISEAPPDGYVVIAPSGDDKSYTQTYSASREILWGFFFGNSEVPVCTAPSITSEPADATKTVGESVTFTVSASGSEPLSYQWQKDGADISGADDSSYTISSVVVADAGSYGVVVSNSCGSATSDEAALAVDKFTPTITWSAPAAIVYGTELGAAQLNAMADVDGKYAYTPDTGTKLDTGMGQTLHVAFTPTDTANYNDASGTVTIDVLKATPVITWENPADITYGTALSDTQLNAVADVAGSFVYSPDTGTVLNAGSRTLHVDFTPTDTANYNGASKEVTITVEKATPVITWSDPAAITYGTELGAAQLDATADVAGTFVFTPPAGTVLDVGADQILHADFTPDDAANYENAGKDVKITVLNPPPELSPIGDMTVEEGSLLDFEVVAHDPNGDTITYAADPVPDGASFDPVTGSFFWAPVSGQAGTYQVTFTASDGYLTDEETITITVESVPTSGSFIGGGGNLVMSNSAGELAATPGTRNFFGLYVKNRRAGPQVGHISVIFRSDGHVYRARTLIIDTLSADPKNGVATITTRATLQDITKPKNPVVIERNAALKLTLTDSKVPGAKDSIGITLSKKDGGLWFSSNWDGEKTVEQELNRGIIVIR